MLGLIAVAAVGTLLTSILLAKGFNRVLGLGIAAVLFGAAARVLGRWEDVTAASSRFTDGPPGHEVHWSEADQFVRSAFGELAMFTLVLLTIALMFSVLVSRVDPPYNAHHLVD